MTPEEMKRNVKEFGLQMKDANPNNTDMTGAFKRQ